MGCMVAATAMPLENELGPEVHLVRQLDSQQGMGETVAALAMANGRPSFSQNSASATLELRDSLQGMAETCAAIAMAIGRPSFDRKSE